MKKLLLSALADVTTVQQSLFDGVESLKDSVAFGSTFSVR